jgi:hypothetical protein
MRIRFESLGRTICWAFEGAVQGWYRTTGARVLWLTGTGPVRRDRGCVVGGVGIYRLAIPAAFRENTLRPCGREFGQERAAPGMALRAQPAAAAGKSVGAVVWCAKRGSRQSQCARTCGARQAVEGVQQLSASTRPWRWAGCRLLSCPMKPHLSNSRVTSAGVGASAAVDVAAAAAPTAGAAAAVVEAAAVADNAAAAARGQDSAATRRRHGVQLRASLLVLQQPVPHPAELGGHTNWCGQHPSVCAHRAKRRLGGAPAARAARRRRGVGRDVHLLVGRECRPVARCRCHPRRAGCCRAGLPAGTSPPRPSRRRLRL